MAVVACLYIGQAEAGVKEFCAGQVSVTPKNIEIYWKGLRSKFSTGNSLNAVCGRALEEFKRDLKKTDDEDELCESHKARICRLYKNNYYPDR